MTTKSRPRYRKTYAPTFGSIVHELFNTAMGDVVHESTRKRISNPATNVLKAEDKWELQLALPGFDKKTIDIQVENDTITVSSKIEPSEGESAYTLREFDYSEFKKAFKIPESIDQGAIKASFDQGVLTISLPLKKEALPQPPKTIKIK